MFYGAIVEASEPSASSAGLEVQQKHKRTRRILTADISDINFWAAALWL